MNWFPFTYILAIVITNSIHAWLTKDYRSSGMTHVSYVDKINVWNIIWKNIIFQLYAKLLAVTLHPALHYSDANKEIPANSVTPEYSSTTQTKLHTDYCVCGYVSDTKQGFKL